MNREPKQERGRWRERGRKRVYTSEKLKYSMTVMHIHGLRTTINISHYRNITVYVRTSRMFVECCKNKRSCKSSGSKASKCTQTSYYNEDICCCSFSSSHHTQQNRLYSRRTFGMMFSVDRSIQYLRAVSASATVTHRQIDSYFSFFVHLIILNDMRMHRPWMRSRYVCCVCLHSRYVFSLFPFESSIVLTSMPLFAPYKCGATVQSTCKSCLLCFFSRLKEEMKTRYFIQSAVAFG